MEMQPKLTSDTVYLPVGDDVYFRNNRGSLKLKGKLLYRWVETLAPYLDGNHTLAELTEGLDPERQALVTELIATLLDQHFLKDTSQDLPHTLRPLELETYASEIAFIDSFCDSPAARFEHFREQQVLVIGSGLTLTGLVHAGLKGGILQLAVLVTGECETNIHRNQEYLDLFHSGDPQQTLQKICAPDWTDEVEVLKTLQPFDVILHLSDRPMLARSCMLNRLCFLHKKIFLQAQIVEGHAWIGPLVHSEASDCWECAWRRLQSNLSDMEEQFPSYALQDQTSTPLSRFVALPTAALVANLLYFEIFKYITGAGPLETAGSLIEVDLETLRTQKHAFLPHPLCKACQHPEPRTKADFRDIIDQLEQGEALDQDLFSKHIAPCFETRLGLFSALDEEYYTQLPFSACKAVVSNPMPQENLHNPLTVLGSESTLGASRRQAALQACELYAANLVDRRLLLSAQQSQGQTIQAERFLNGLPQEEVKEWVWASDLESGQLSLVPAPLAYPVLLGFSPLSEHGRGVSSGMSWAEAVSRALLQMCQHLTVTHMQNNAQRPYPLIDFERMPLEPEGTSQRHTLAYILEKMGEILTVYDVTGPLQVPAFAFCLGEKAIAYSTQFTVAHTLRDGLEKALRRWQLAQRQPPDDLLLTGPQLPVALRDDAVRRPHDILPAGWLERQRWLQQRLRRQGWRSFAIPLDHDPVLSRIQPYIARVLLARAEMEEEE